MSTLNALLSACQTEQEPLLAATRERVAQWDNLLQPLSGSSPAGEDPGYDDDFQHMREISPGNDDILALEPEAVALADSEGPDAALGRLQARPGITIVRQQWLLRLLMGRIAEQYGKMTWRCICLRIWTSGPVSSPLRTGSLSCCLRYRPVI